MLLLAVLSILVIFAAANVADLLVIGVDLDPADPRAYPIEILNYHEIVNDVIAGRHVAITWSPLTYSNVLIETESLLSPRTIGTSGKLYQNNLVPYDRATHTYWSQMGGFALKGSLLGSKFVRGQSTLTTWATWKKLYPTTKVLDRPAGSTKNYLSDPYAGYRKNDRLLYESCFENHRTESPYRNKGTKEITLVVFTDRGNTHLFPTSESNLVQNIEDLDDEYFILIWDQRNKLAFAYNRVNNGTRLSFVDGGTPIGGGVRLPTLKDRQTGSVWNVSGTCISGPLRGTQLRRLTSFTTYWSAATSFFPKSQIWMDNTTLQYFPTSCPRPSIDSACSVPCSTIVSAGPAQDTIKSIDNPKFMTPAEFEAIVRVPWRTVTGYSLILSFFVAVATAIFSYNLYHKWSEKLRAVRPAPAAPTGRDEPKSILASTVGSAVARQAADEVGLAPLVLKEDDEEEPALPPEAEDDIPKFAAPAKEPAPPRRRKRNKKHGRSASLVTDDNSVPMETLQVPMSARGPSRKFSSHGFPVPRLSMQPYTMTVDTRMNPTNETRLSVDKPIPRNKSDSNLGELEASSAASTPPMSHSGDIPRIPLSQVQFIAPPQRQAPLAAQTSPLFHRPTSPSNPPTSPSSSGARSGFDMALQNSKEYTTSIDSDLPGNYQISLTSVQSGDDEIPEHIISAAALARIKGDVKKSPSLHAREVFKPVAETIPEHGDGPSIPTASSSHAPNPSSSDNSHTPPHDA